jgi:PAS domain S-box-containing protein
MLRAIGSRSTLRFNLEKKIALGFAVALGCMLALAGAAWRSAARFAETFRWVDHTHEVLYELESSLTDALNIQTSTRGFLLTGREAFLAPYLEGTSRVEPDLRRLRLLTADNPSQGRRLDRMDRLVAHLLDLARGRIARRRLEAFDPAREGGMLDAGEGVVAEVRALVGEMGTEERRLLAERSAAAQADQRLARWVLGLGSLTATGLVVAAGLAVQRGFRQQVAAEAERDRFFSLSLDLMCISSGDGFFRRVSPAITDILGWTVAEFLTRPYIDLVHPDDRAATEAEVRRQIVAGETVFHFENRYLHRDGSWRMLSWRSVPQPGGLMYATARDVTDLRQHETLIHLLNTDLKRHASELEIANRELEAFSYSASHDLRRPLRQISGLAAMLQRNKAGTLDGPGREQLRDISGAVRQMDRLIDDLLGFSRMSRAHLQFGEVDQDLLV